MRPLDLVGLVLVLAVAIALPFGLCGFRVFQFTQVLIYAIALLGLNMLTGYNGQISLGHGAFYAIGAYTTAIMIDRWNIGYGWTIPVAGILCLVVGFLFGRPALRLEGLYLALATFALALSVPQILKYFEHWTGGSQGIVLSKPKPPFGLRLNEDQWLYFLTLAITIVLFVLAWNLLRGRVGRAIVAIRDNHIAAEAMGVDNALYKSTVFGVSAAYTGIAGALSALAIAFVAPDSFNVFLSITFLTGIVIGGLATISGAMFGALFIQFVPNWAQDISKAAPWAIFGIFLIVFMYVMPRGIAGFFRAGVDPDDPAGSCKRETPVTGAAAGGARHITLNSNGRNTMSLSKRFLALVVGLGVTGLVAGGATAQTVVGVTATEIKIGNTNPYSGPASAYGTIGKAIGAYFKKVNDEGGINGRKINYISYDDAYSPPKTVEMVRKLVEQDQVAFLFQTLGTPPNSAIHKYVNQQKVPQLFVATGATKWNDPQNFPWTMGYQPNYQTEGRIYAAVRR